MSLDEVVEWLKSKGFNQDIHDNFIGNFSLFLATYVEPDFFLQNKKSQAMYCSNSMSTSSNLKSASWHLENMCTLPTLLPTFLAPLASRIQTTKTHLNNRSGATVVAMGVGLGIALSPIPSSNEEAFHALRGPIRQDIT